MTAWGQTIVATTDLVLGRAHYTLPERLYRLRRVEVLTPSGAWSALEEVAPNAPVGERQCRMFGGVLALSWVPTGGVRQGLRIEYEERGVEEVRRGE